jgi:micrococcal nuclease
MYDYKLKIERVVDGDTVDGIIDLGFNVSTSLRIRLAGIDAPESRTRNLDEKRYGLEAKARLEEIVSGDGELTIQSHGLGKYGRVIGTLFMNDRSVNRQLIDEGYAIVYTGSAKIEVSELLEKLDNARSSKKG